MPERDWADEKAAEWWKGPRPSHARFARELRSAYERGLREGAAWPAAALTKADRIARDRERLEEP